MVLLDLISYLFCLQATTLSRENRENKIAVAVTDVTDNVRYHGTPKFTVRK